MSFRVLLLRLKVHKVTGFLNNLFLKIANFNKLSSWVGENADLGYNDFYNKRGEYTDRYNLFLYLVKNEIKEKEINYLEFGVGDGETLKWWLNMLPGKKSSFYGFDSFEGLPEDWSVYKREAFTHKGKSPEIDDPRAKIIKGLFQTTLNGFLSDFDNSKCNLIVLDADLYSSTLFVLTSIAPYLKKDDIIIFDEFFSPQHEFLAYNNFCQSFTHIKLKAIGAAYNYTFVAFKVV